MSEHPAVTKGKAAVTDLEQDRSLDARQCAELIGEIEDFAMASRQGRSRTVSTTRRTFRLTAGAVGSRLARLRSWSIERFKHA